MAERTRTIDAVAADAATRLGLKCALTFPSRLVELLDAEVELLILEKSKLPRGLFGEPDIEFAVLGPGMTECFDDYGFARWLPGAWPLAFDGGGGLYCLDLREVVARRAPNDGSAPIVWAHAGNLTWTDGEWVKLGETMDDFLTATHARIWPRNRSGEYAAPR